MNHLIRSFLFATMTTRSIQLAILAAVVAACATEPSAADGSIPCDGDEVSVPVGGSVRSAGGASGCRLRANPGAEYALAVLDGSAIASALTGREAVSFSDYVASLAVNAPPTASRPTFRVSGLPDPNQMVDQITLVSSPRDTLLYPTGRNRPWTIGEQFLMGDAFSGCLGSCDATAALKVLRIYEGRYVVAWFEQGDASRLSAFLPRLDSAFVAVRDIAFPLQRAVFADAAPVTSSAAGQYLVILRDSLPLNGQAYGGYAFTAATADTIFGWIYLQVSASQSWVTLASLLAHEMTHTYQRMYLHATRSPGQVSALGAAFWAIEGGANLVSYETVRRLAGIAPDANFDWRLPSASPVMQYYALRAQPSAGQLTNGYDNAMGFMRDLVLRRLASGDGLDQALREVSRGVIEGWYGFDGATHREGLVSRMRSRLGGQWEPAAAVLDWTLSHAADDVTDNPYFQDRASLRVWDIPGGQTYGWRPAATLTSDGGAVTVSRRYGSPLFVYLRDDGAGLSFQVSGHADTGDPHAPPLRDLPWKLVRMR